MDDNNYWPFDDYQSDHRFRELVRKLKESSDGGVAFFGAGTSVPAGFPNWTDFHKNFLAHFKAQLGENLANPDLAILTDIDYHTNRDSDKALSFVKDTFAVPIPDIPSIVRTVRSTRSLRYFYTTNFDEVLFKSADGEPVAIYPNFMPMHARFVYLHGRASSASSIHGDLVLGETGYKRAYGESDVSQTKSKIALLAPYPVIFIGFSMRDQSVARTIEQISQAARYRQVLPIDGEAVEAISPLSWYILLKAPILTDPGRIQEKSSREERLSLLGITVIWYQDGGPTDEHRCVLEVVHKIQRESRNLPMSETNPAFAERLLEATDIASLATPTSSQLRLAKAILEGHPRIAAAFLNRVDGLDWFRGLRDAGSLQPKASFATTSGELRAPHWQAASFLQRVASVAPSEVKDFLLGIEIDNWFAIRQAFGILETLDEGAGEELGTRFARWAVGAMIVDSKLLLDVSATAERLNLTDKPKAAQNLVFATLLELANTSLTFSEGATARFSEVVALVLAHSTSGLNIIEKARGTALERECVTPEQDNIRYSRPAIESHRMNSPERSIVGLMIDLTRETLLKSDDAGRRSVAINTLLRSQWPTERRIGIAHCFLQRPDFLANESAILTKENLSNPNLFHELAKLLADNVKDLSDQAIETLKEFVETLHRGDTDTQRNEYILWAAILPPEFLPELLEEIQEEDHDPERHLFRDFYVSRFFTPTAPMDGSSFAERAASLDAHQLLDLVREPTSAGIPVKWRYSADLMWTLLAEYVKETGTLDPILKINVDDFARDGVWKVIEAIPEVAGDDPALWQEVFDWTGHLIPAAAPEMLRLLGQLIKSSASAAPIGLSEGVRNLAMAVIERTKRTNRPQTETTNDSLLLGFLNHPAGMTVHALFELLRREVIESETTGKSREKIGEWFSQDVLEPMAQTSMALGVDAWIGLGRYYPLVSVWNPETVEFVVSHLCSEDSELSITSTGFWVGYLWAPFVSSDALKQLYEAYRAHAPLLEMKGTLELDLKDRFFHHLVIGAVRDSPGYEDLLMSTLGATFSPETRGSIGFSLGRSLYDAREEQDVPLYERIQSLFVRYWTAHVERLGGRDGSHLAKYLLWVSHLDLPPSDLIGLIEASLGTGRKQSRCWGNLQVLAESP